MRASRIALLVLAVAVVGGVAYAVLHEEPPKPTEVVTADARAMRIVAKVRAIGHVEPVTQVKVSANITGDLLALHVKEGETVKRGTLLAEIDRERLQAVVRQNQAAAGSAEASVLLETTQRVQAEAELKRTQSLATQGLATPAELERAKSDVEVIRAREEAAKQRALQAKAALDEATERFAKARLFAPIDGTVIVLNKKVGERIRGSELAEDVLLTLAPLHAMQVEIEISEQDVVKVHEGQSAEIAVDALGGEVIPGRVVEIANSAVITNKGTEMETTSFRVKVALERIPERLRSGMSSQVSVITATREGVVGVPLEAVTARLPSELEPKKDGDQKKDEGIFFREGTEAEKKEVDPIARRERPVDLVFVVVDGKAEPRRVKTGISSELDVEILDGLEAGAEVVIGPYKALSKTLEPSGAVKVLRKLPPPSPEPTKTAQGG